MPYITSGCILRPGNRWFNRDKLKYKICRMSYTSTHVDSNDVFAIMWQALYYNDFMPFNYSRMIMSQYRRWGNKVHQEGRVSLVCLSCTRFYSLVRPIDDIDHPELGPRHRQPFRCSPRICRYLSLPYAARHAAPDRGGVSVYDSMYTYRAHPRTPAQWGWPADSMSATRVTQNEDDC